jgi:hypothetical protein
MLKSDKGWLANCPIGNCERDGTLTPDSLSSQDNNLGAEFEGAPGERIA